MPMPVECGPSPCAWRRPIASIAIQTRRADEQQGLGERSEVLRLAVPVLVALVGGPLGDGDRVQRQQRRERVGRRVHGLGEHAEAARRDADEEP